MAVLPRMLVEVIESMPAISANSFSSGRATADAMVSGLAPGRLAVTCMVGKSTFGSAASAQTFGTSAQGFGGAGGSREVVILLDQSASMGYGDRWQRAKTEAERVIDSLGATDKASLVLFGRNAEENMRATSDRGRLQAALRSATLTSGGTRFGPALKLAESILLRSQLQRREAVLISDFQKTGWTGSEDVHFPDGTVMNSVDFVNRLSRIGSSNISTFMDGAAITNAYIGNAEVSTLKIQGNAVTIPVG